MGRRALIPVGKLLQYNYPHVCGSTTWVVWDLITLQVHQSVVVSSLCLWMWNIFFVDSNLFLMGACSVLCCGFGLLVRGGELYFIILSLSSPFQTFGYIYCIYCVYNDSPILWVKGCWKARKCIYDRDRSVWIWIQHLYLQPPYCGWHSIAQNYEYQDRKDLSSHQSFRHMNSNPNGHI